MPADYIYFSLGLYRNLKALNTAQSLTLFFLSFIISYYFNPILCYSWD